MSSELRDLYQSLILDHNRSPRNFHRPESTTCQADGYNPLCGDKVTVYLALEGDTIRDVGFTGSGCAISTASASLMTESLRGKTVQEAQTLFGHFHGVVTGQEPADPEQLGKLAIFSGVSEYPARVKCASLAWHTLNSALKGDQTPVTTE